MMNNKVIQLLLIVFMQLFSLVIVKSPLTPPQNIPSDISATNKFSEDFSSFSYKRYVSDTAWNTTSGELSLLKLDAIDQRNPDIVPTSNNQFILVWGDDREGLSNFYMQKIDANGNRLWLSDQRVNMGVPGTGLSYPRAASDSQGNVYVTWADDRAGSYNVYAQKIDSDGNPLWASDMLVNKSTGRSFFKPSIAVDSANRAVITWRSKENGSMVYAQRLSLAGVPQWSNDVQVSQDPTNAPQSYIDDPVIKTNKTGGIAISWFSHDALTPTSVSLRIQRLGSDGSRAWSNDLVLGATEALSYRAPYQAIDLDDANNVYAVWWIGSEFALQKVSGAGSIVWGNPKILTGLSGSNFYALLLELTSDSKLLIAWGQKLVIANTSGETLSAAPIDLGSQGHNASYSPTRLTLGIDGAAYAAWSRESIYTSGSEDVFVRKMILNPEFYFPWPIEAAVSDHNGSIVADEPRLAPANGGFYFAWNDVRNDDWSVFINRLDSNGKLLWPTGILITSPGSNLGGGGLFDLATFSNGDAVVVAVTYGPMLIQPVDLHGNKLPSRSIATIGIDPHVAVDKQDNIIVAWNDWGLFRVMKFSRDLQILWGPVTVTVGPCGGTNGTMGDAVDVATDNDGNIIIVWQDTRNRTYPGSDLYAQKLDANGNPQWGDGVDVDPGYIWYSSKVAVQVDSANHIYVGWRDPWNWIYLRRLAPNGTFDWVYPSGFGEGSQLAVSTVGDTSYISYAWNANSPFLRAYSSNQALLWANPISLGVRNTVSSNTTLSVLNNNVYAAWQQNNHQVYLQKTNSTGNVQWPNPVNIAVPDTLYHSTGIAESVTVDNISTPIQQATLTADYQTNSGDVQFWLSNNGGIDWLPATPGVAVNFLTVGSDLRWKAKLFGDPVWPRTPVIDGIQIEYTSQAANADDYEPDDTCANARPIAINGAAQTHTSHQVADADWVWFDAIAGTNYIVETINTGSLAKTEVVALPNCTTPLSSTSRSFGNGYSISFTATASTRHYVRVTQQDSTIFSPDTDYTVSVRVQPPTAVALIVAGRDGNNSEVGNILYSADRAYRVFLNAGLGKANVRYLTPANSDHDGDGDGINDSAGVSTPANLRDSIQIWARERGVRLGVPLIIYMVDHGLVDHFKADGDDLSQQVSAADLNLWLSNLEATTGIDNITVIIDACYSGSFIDVTPNGPGSISGHGRVIISSASSGGDAYGPTNGRGLYFSNAFFGALESQQSMWASFVAGREAVAAQGQGQQPWLDDNGDKLMDSQDGSLSRNAALRRVAMGGQAPQLEWVSVDQATGLLRVKVTDDSAWVEPRVEVFAPSFQAPPADGQGTTRLLDVPVVVLSDADGDRIYEGVYALPELGRYRLVVQAEDSEGNLAMPASITLDTRKKTFLPLTRR